jgi:hypothetical protein
MADYSAKVYMKQGGDELVVASGGKITVESGGSFDAGSAVTAVEFDTDDFAVADGSVSLSTARTALLTIVASIPTTDPADGATIWNDGGVLKAASAA